MNKFFVLIFIVTLFSFSSCVTKKKYQLAEDGRIDAIARGNRLNKQLMDCEQENESRGRQIRDLLNDTTVMGKSLRNYESMLNLNLSEQDKLNALLNEKINELDKREKTINDLQYLINEQNEKVQSILNNVKEALLGFSSDELSVMEKNGKVYIAMSDKLLFESGSAKVDKRGEDALAKLAEVLIKQSDIDVTIEGHTDSKPINTVQFKDNWDLSVIRATSVVRILTGQYGVNPLQILPSGRGEYMPVASNETAEGRSKNRRTEIIISPKLDKLYEMLN